MNKVRWGIVGPGNIAHRFAEAVKNVPGAELVAVASRSLESGKAFAEKYDIPNVFEGYDKLAESDMIDAVYISTPHPFHKPQSEMFMNAGKHVLCEKPICVNAKEAEILRASAKKNGVFLMEAMWTRFLPAIKEAKAIADSGEIGEIRAVEADFCFNSPPEVAPIRIFSPDLAGGALLDIGVYCLHFAAEILGSQPEEIVSVAATDGKVDLHTTSLLKYKSGAVANLSSSISVTKPDTAYVYGSKGRIFIPHFYTAKELFITTDAGERHIVKEYLGNGFEEQIIEACNCIRNGKLESDVVSLDESITIMKQMDLIREQIGIRYPFED